MKVAIVHDWLTGYRGGERILVSLLKLFPDAPIYTLVCNRDNIPKELSDRVIKTSFLQKIPFGTRFYRHFLPFFPIISEFLLDKKYDYILSTSTAIAKSVNTKGTPHWCYINTPMRYIWDRFDDYFGSERVGFLNLFFKLLAFFLRKYDVWSSKRVNVYVSNSNFVKKRVSKFYKRDSEVIYPPVSVDKFKVEDRKRQGYLFFSHLVPYKKAHHAILACIKLKRNLAVAGSGGELKFLKKISDSRYISFLGNIAEDEKQKLFSDKLALLYPGVEDFGIVPVEANATGLPVIGFGQGGLLETQTQDTCQFYDTQTVDGLCDAILKFENRKFDYNKIRQHSLKFSEEIFNQKIKASLDKFLNQV